ncbi:hypothetical protein JCM10908_003292 [Rhodotorula pacifica]|uniref:Psy2p n=1 Tax=Rhodotorula pacifica TaxID=1495444 RepID=UPI003178149D
MEDVHMVIEPEVSSGADAGATTNSRDKDANPASPPTTVTAAGATEGDVNGPSAPLERDNAPIADNGDQDEKTVSSSAGQQNANTTPKRGGASTASTSATTPTSSGGGRPARRSSSTQGASPATSREKPNSSSSSPAGDSSPSSSTSRAAAAGSSPSPSSSSPSSSPSNPTTTTSSSPASHSPSRRVKVYRLKDDAWIDLGTGTCTGEFLQSVPTTATDTGAEGEPVEEGAWILVKREKPSPGGGGAGVLVRGKTKERKKRDAEGRRVNKAGDGSPVSKKKKKKKDDKSDPSAVAKGLFADDPADDGDSSSSSADEADPDPEADNAAAADDDDNLANVILRSRVQPYPPGISPDDLPDDDEVTSVDENGNMTIDAGGYQRQQETLIVWTERVPVSSAGGGEGEGGEQEEEEEEQEMALSFATGSGCSEIWEFIKAARRYLAEQAALRSPSPSPSDALSSPPRHLFPNSSSIASLAHSLPDPQLGSIPEFDTALRNMSRSAVGRERAASVVLRTGVIEKLCGLQKEAEEKESLEDLHALCRAMQQILLLNDNAIFEHVLQDDIILGVVGILEYDPEFPTMRASYRQHLSSPTAFVPVLPPDVLTPPLLGKIHQTHRLHYLKDIVLARIIEDSTFSMLNSAIYFNEVEIVNVFNHNKEMLAEVFAILKQKDPKAEEEKAQKSPAANGKDADEVTETTKAPSSPSKNKERNLALGPKRTIGPDLPDDLLAERATKRPRIGSTPPPPGGAAGVPSPLSSPDKPTPAGIDPSTLSESERKLHAMLFLQQLAQMAKNLQLPPRTTFYKNMCEQGLLSALEGALRFAIELPPEEEDTASTIRSAALGVWIAVVDLDPADVRAFCLRQGKEQELRQEAESEKEGGGGDGGGGEDLAAVLEADLAEESLSPEEAERLAREKKTREERSTLLGLLLCMFKDEEDLGIKAQLTEALRVLVDVTGEGSIQPGPRLRQEDPEAERFLQYFYDHCVLSLVQPLVDLPERKESDPPLSLSAANIAILTHLCELLCFFVSNHTFRSKYLILSTPTLAKAIGRLLRPKPRLTRHTHLRLAALRFLRACVARSDEFYNRFLVKHDLIRPVLETAAEERDKDNLLGSACLEFFEHLRVANVKALLNHVMDRSGEVARKLAASTGMSPALRTFEALIQRWEMNNEPPPPVSLMADTSTDSAQSPSTGATSSSMQRQTSQPGWTPRRELEEESYFNTSDDEEEDGGDDAFTKSWAESKPLLFGPSPDILKSPSIVTSRRKSERAAEGDAKPESLSWFADRASRTPKDAKAWNSLSRESKVPLVQYGEDEAPSDDDAEDKPKQATSAADPLAGGFIKEGSAETPDDNDDGARGITSKKRGSLEDDGSKPNVTLESFRQDITTPPAGPDEDGSPPFLPSLGSLKRKKEEDDDDDGELGLLAKKRAPSSAGSPSSKPSLGTAASATPSSSTVAGSTATAPATTKLGGFKIALGGLKSKFGQGKASDTPGGAAKPGG